MLKRKDLKEVKLRDRYLGIIHLVTAADGAEEFYTGENNTARIETPEEAIHLDRRTRESWLGHPHLKIIDNRTDFEGKIRRAFTAIAQLLGIPAPSARKERFIVRGIVDEELPTHQAVRIEQVYLRSTNRDEEVCIRKRGHEDSFLYFLRRTRKAPFAATSEELIDEQQFMNLGKLIAPKTDPVIKDRICFLWGNQHFELDRYRGNNEGLAVLAVEAVGIEEEEAKPQIPPFITIETNITGNPRYAEKAMAMKRKDS
jgi:CYTH domain-containing protein